MYAINNNSKKWNNRGNDQKGSERDATIEEGIVSGVWAMHRGLPAKHTYPRESLSKQQRLYTD